MALPLLPIVLIGGLVLMAGATKKKNGTTTPNGNGGKVVVLNGMAELGGVIDLNPGDTLQVNLPDVPGAAWGLFTEATAGDPQAVIQEGTAEDPAVYRATITPSAVGSLVVDFMALDVNQNAVETGAQTVLNVVA